MSFVNKKEITNLKVIDNYYSGYILLSGEYLGQPIEIRKSCGKDAYFYLKGKRYYVKLESDLNYLLKELTEEEIKANILKDQDNPVLKLIKKEEALKLLDDYKVILEMTTFYSVTGTSTVWYDVEGLDMGFMFVDNLPTYEKNLIATEKSLRERFREWLEMDYVLKEELDDGDVVIYAFYIDSGRTIETEHVVQTWTLTKRNLLDAVFIYD